MLRGGRVCFGGYPFLGGSFFFTRSGFLLGLVMGWLVGWLVCIMFSRPLLEAPLEGHQWKF